MLEFCAAVTKYAQHSHHSLNFSLTATSTCQNFSTHLSLLSVITSNGNKGKTHCLWTRFVNYLYNKFLYCEIQGSHGSEYKDYWLLGCDAM